MYTSYWTFIFSPCNPSHVNLILWSAIRTYKDKREIFPPDTLTHIFKRFHINASFDGRGSEEVILSSSISYECTHFKASNHMFKIENSSRLEPSKSICLDYSYNNIVSNGEGGNFKKTN